MNGRERLYQWTIGLSWAIVVMLLTIRGTECRMASQADLVALAVTVAKHQEIDQQPVTQERILRIEATYAATIRALEARFDRLELLLDQLVAEQRRKENP